MISTDPAHAGATAPGRKARLLIVLFLAALLLTLLFLPALAQDAPQAYLVTAAKAYAYQGPGEYYPLLAIYTQGITLTVTGRTPDSAWIQVALTPYNTAWMLAASFIEAPTLAELPLAATPAGLATVTPDPGPPLTLDVKLVLNSWLKTQVFEIKVHTRQPYTRITIFLNNSQGRTISRRAMSTDGQGDLTITFGSGLLTDGTHMVVVTDSFGNTVQKSAVVTGWHKPTPTPEK